MDFEKFHQELVVVDGHNHLFVELTDKRNKDANVTFDNFCAPLLKKGQIDVMVTTIGGDNPCLTNLSDLYLVGSLLNIDEVLQVIKETDYLTLCKSYDEIQKAISEGKTAIVFSMEGARPLQSRPCLDGPDLLRVFYELGLRLLQLVDNGRNWIGDGSGQARTKSRLTPAGVETIKEMNSLGILIDVSHLIDEGFWDVMSITDSPILATHSNARAVRDHPRNLSDEQIKAIADNGGLVGITFANFMVSDKKDPDFSDVLKHIQYIADLIGTDNIGLGPDLLGDVTVYPGKPGWLEGIYTGMEGKTSNRVKGFTDVSCFPDVTKGLMQAGFSKEETKKIMGGNYLRIFKEVLK